jgi:hypothetical protein
MCRGIRDFATQPTSGKRTKCRPHRAALSAVAVPAHPAADARRSPPPRDPEPEQTGPIVEVDRQDDLQQEIKDQACTFEEDQPDEGHPLTRHRDAQGRSPDYDDSLMMRMIFE